MASVIGTHVISPIGGPVVHVPPNGQSAFSDNACVIDIYEMGYYGAQSGSFSNGVIGASSNVAVTGLGSADDGIAINAAIAALAGTGRILYFPTGTFKITTAVVNPSGVQMQVGPLVQFTGTNAFTMAVASGGAASGQNLPGYVRGVFTTITTSTTYTGTTTSTLTFGSNAIMGAQDGITPVVGDVFLLQGGTLGSCAITACDTGPWMFSVIGTASTKCVLVRPNWWPTGAAIPQLYQLTVGNEGTLYGGGKWTSWGTTPTAAIFVGTTATDPLFYPDQVSTQVTFATTNLFTLATVPIRSATRTTISITPTALSGTRVGTVGYGIVTAPTAGYLSTATFAISALATAMALNSSDASTSIMSVLITNRACAG